MRSAPIKAPQLVPAIVPEHRIEAIEDDRASLQEADAVLLVVEDDPHYARLLRDLARDKGFKVLVATRGAEALALAPRVPSHGRFP